MTKIISEIAVLTEDLNLLIARINEKERSNNELPIDVFLRSVTTTLNKLENEYEIELQGYTADWLQYGVQDYIKSDLEDVDKSKQAIEKRAKQLRFNLRNGTFELPTKMKTAKQL